VDGVDQIPIGVLHVLEADVSEDTGIVNENINAAECLDSSLDDLLAIVDAVVVGNGLSTGLSDLVDDNIGSLGVAALALEGATQVVDHDIGTSGCEEQTVAMWLLAALLLLVFSRRLTPCPVLLQHP
jgi:hypothetical protein